MTAQATEQVFESEEMTVEGRKIEERLSAELAEYGHQAVIIEGKQLEDTGFVDVQSALNALVPGLYISVNSGRGDYSTSKMHGSSDILWLLDGVRLNNRLYGSAYIDTISVKMIERIEVLMGGEGLFYGTNARSGIINIITKKITDKTSGQIGASVGTQGFRDVYGHVSTTVNGHGLMLFGSYDGWDGYKLYDDWVYNHPSINAANQSKREYQRGMFGAKYEYRFENLGKGATFKFHIQRNIGEFDYYNFDTKARNDRTEDIQFIKWDHDVTDNFSYYIKAFNHRWWTDYTRIWLKPGRKNNYDDMWGYEDRGVNVMGSYRFLDKTQEILFGYDWQNYWAQDDVLVIDREEENVHALFFQYRPTFSFYPDATFALGARFNKTGGNEITIWNISTRLPLFSDLLALRGVIGTSFALPNAEQLHENDGNERSWTYGNPDLKPEDSLNIDVGLQGKYSIFNWDLGWYWQETDNKIGTVLDRYNGVQEIYTFTNLDGKWKYYGFDLTLGAQLTDEIKILSNLTTADAKRSDDERQISGTPKYMVKLNLQYKEKKGRWGASLESQYVGETEGWFTTSNTGEKYTVDYGKYFLVNASGFYAFGDENRHRLTLRIENLFDKTYPNSVSRAAERDSTGNTIHDADGNIVYRNYNRHGIPFSAILGYSYTF